MKFYFQWTNNFADKAICDNSIDIVSISVSQKEGEFAIARVKMTSRENIGDYKFGVIGIKNSNIDEIIFIGRVINIPISENKDFVIIELISQPENYGTMLQNLIDENKKRPHFDELFFNSDDEKNVLEATGALFYCDKVTGIVSLSDIVTGKHIFDIGTKYIPSSFIARYVSDPIDQIDLSIKVQWVTENSVIVDLYDKIKNALSGGTFSGADFIEKFHKVVKKIENSKNYIVLSSRICEVNHCKVSKQLGDKTVQLRKSHIAGELTVRSFFYNKRIEEFNVTILNAHSSHKTKKIKKLHFDIGSLEGYGLINDNDSFFGQDRGQEAIQHALLRAASYIKFSSRAMHVSFVGAFEDLYKVTIDDSVAFESGQFLRKKIIGKVIQTELFADYKGRYIKITIAVSLGRDDFTEHEAIFANLKLTSTAAPVVVSNNEMIKSIEISGDINSQQASLIDADFENIDDFAKKAEAVKTNIVLKLRDSASMGVIKSCICADAITISSKSGILSNEKS